MRKLEVQVPLALVARWSESVSRMACELILYAFSFKLLAPRKRLCFRMCLVIDVHETADIDMRVDLCRAEARVTEHFLHHAQIRAVCKHVRCKGMAQFMRRAVDGQIGFQKIGFEPTFDGSRRQPLAFLIQEEGPMDASFGQADDFTLAQIFAQCLVGVASHDANAFFAAFSSDAEVVGHEVDIFKIKADGFTDTKSCAVDDFQNGRVPCREKIAFAATVCLALQIGLLFAPIGFGGA